MDGRQKKIHANPKFAKLVSDRRRFAWTLTLLVLGSFFIYLMIGILSPKWLTVPIHEGAITTIAYPISGALIVLAWVMTGIYTSRANKDFDARCKEILEESTK